MGFKAIDSPSPHIPWKGWVETVEEGSRVDGFGQGVLFCSSRLPYRSQGLKELPSARALGAGLGGSASSRLLQTAGVESQVLTPCVLGPRMAHQDVGSGGVGEGSFYYRRMRGRGES